MRFLIAASIAAAALAGDMNGNWAGDPEQDHSEFVQRFGTFADRAASDRFAALDDRFTHATAAFSTTVGLAPARNEQLSEHLLEKVQLASADPTARDVIDVGPTDEDFAATTAIESPAAAETSTEVTMSEVCSALATAAEENGIPVAFFARLIWQESRFKSKEISNAGAQGMAQFMPETAAEMGLDDPFDPLKALPASARFLRKLHDQFGNLGLAAAAYNAGGGRIQNWLARRETLPAETKNYVRIITGSSAENWAAESQTVALHSELPRTAPCEGFGGLSRDKDVANVPVALTPLSSGLIRKARIVAERAAAARVALAARRSKSRLALAHRQSGKEAKSDDSAKIEEASASEEKVARSRHGRVKLASAIRSRSANATKTVERRHRVRVASR